MSGTSSFIILSTYALLFSLLLSSFGCAENGVNEFLAQKNDASEEISLVSFLTSRTQRHDAIFTEAVQLLESMKSSPSCNRIAASRLVTSCQSIGGKADKVETDTYLALDHIRSLYAARLAICELKGAGTSIPPPCLPVTTPPPQRKGLFGFYSKSKSQINIENSMPTELLESCLRSLESRPQWWTSYSNSRQNAIVICQAARLENEKEELLELHRSIVESSIKLNHGLQEALRMAAAESSQHQAFIQTIQILQNMLAEDLEKTESQFKTTMDRFLHEIESSVDWVTTSVTSALGKAQVGAAALEKDIQNVTSEVYHLQQILQVVHDETLERNEEVTVAHRQNSQLHNELALSLQSKLESLLQGDLVRLYQNVETFDASLEWLSGRVGLILQQELSISERLRSFETSLEETQLKAEDLLQAQLQQSEALETQSKLQKNLQINMQISQALLDKATATAANLQAIIDETTTRYREFPGLGGLVGPHSAWAVCGLFISIIAAQKSKLAMAVLVIGSIHLTATRYF